MATGMSTVKFQSRQRATRAFEQADGLAQLSPDAVEIREAQTREDEAERVIDGFRDPDGFLSVSVSLVEHAALGKGARQVGTRPHGRKRGEAEPLTDPIALEQLHRVSGRRARSRDSRPQVWQTDAR